MARRSKAKPAEPPAAPDAATPMRPHHHLDEASRPPPGVTSASRAPRPRPTEAAFDRWLQRELSRLYGPALEEPVPEELLRLVREAAGKKPS
jgi:hypothetical protein